MEGKWRDDPAEGRRDDRPAVRPFFLAICGSESQNSLNDGTVELSAIPDIVGRKILVLS